MILEHYSNRHLEWPPREYDQTVQQGGAFKPNGLWVSVPGEYDWPAWCSAEDFRRSYLTHKTVVKLAEDHNVLVIDNEVSLRAFDEKYSTEMHPGITLRVIDWERVATEYDGLIVAPYLWSCRFDLTWYYGWDCASGCIWNSKAIAAFEVAEEEV